MVERILSSWCSTAPSKGGPFPEQPRGKFYSGIGGNSRLLCRSHCGNLIGLLLDTIHPTRASCHNRRETRSLAVRRRLPRYLNQEPRPDATSQPLLSPNVLSFIGAIRLRNSGPCLFRFTTFKYYLCAPRARFSISAFQTSAGHAAMRQKWHIWVAPSYLNCLNTIV